MDELRGRVAPLEISPDEFRSLGHQMVDYIADFLATLRPHDGA